MDDRQVQARMDATAMVARDFEPVRIEHQLLARAFDLVCEIEARTSFPLREVTEPSTDDPSPEDSASIDLERRRAA